MAGITPESIDRLHANLLTSGIQQQNQALFYVVDQLINAVRQSLSNVQAITGGGGGGGGGILGQSFITGDNDAATLPNSLQLVTSNLNFNRSANRLTVNAPVPYPFDGEDGNDGYPIPGIQGIQGIMGPMGPPGMDAYCELYESAQHFPGTLTGAEQVGFYKEGSWLPELTFAGSGAGITYTNQAGQYIKIGKFVACFGLITLSNKGATVGGAGLTGFPFGFNNDGVGGITCSKIGYTNFTAGVQEVGLQAGGSGGTVALPVKSVAGINTGMTDADFTNTSAMILYMCYKSND